MTTINLTIGMKVFLILWAVSAIVFVVSITALITMLVIEEMEYRKHQRDDRKLIRMVNKKGRA